VRGSLGSHGFDHGFRPDLPVSLLLSVALHVGLLLLLSYSPFRVISNAGQPTLISVDLAAAPEEVSETSSAPVEKAETPPVQPTPPPVVKKAEPKAKPAPAKDDVVLKKVKKKPEPVREEKTPVEEAKPVPPTEVAPAQRKLRLVRRKAPTTAAASEETNPISALEGAREGVDASTNYYIQNMVAQIARRWQPPGTVRYDRGVQPVIVYFKIQKDGRITHISIETSSGRKDLDLSAERAVIETRTVPPLPPNLMQDDTLGVYFKFIPKLAGG